LDGKRLDKRIGPDLFIGWAPEEAHRLIKNSAVSTASLASIGLTPALIHSTQRYPVSLKRVSRAVLVAAGMASCQPTPDVAVLFDTTPTRTEFPDSIPMEPYRDTLLGIEFLRPRGLHVLAMNRMCSDSFPEPRSHRDWDEDGGPMIAAAWTRAPLENVAGANLIESTPEGWKSYGRLGAANSVDVAIGSRWRQLSGSRDVGVPLEGGGMATDSRHVKVALIDRGDGCALALTSNFDGAELSDALADWQMLESVRFLDSRGAPIEASGWLDTLPLARRAGISRSGAYDGACLSIENDAVRPGTPVTMIEFTGTQRIVSYGVVRVDQSAVCTDSTRESRVPAYNVEILRSVYNRVDVAIGVLGIVVLDTTMNALRTDVDGDGVQERFGICGSVDGKVTWAWLIAATTPAPTVIWQRRFDDLARTWSPCTAGVRSLLR